MNTTATKTAKQIIDALTFLTKEQKAYIMNNKISHLPLNIEISKDTHKFIFITNFAHIEQIEIPADDFRIWEHFSMLNDMKTAINCMTAIAEGRKFSMKFFDNQKNITPKKQITATGFMEFFNGLTPEEKTHLKAEILRWDSENLMNNLESYLANYQQNDGDKFKTGDYIIYFDSIQNASFYGRIFQAEKNGLIMVNTTDHSLIADNKMTLEIIPAEKIPAQFKKPIDEFYTNYSEAGDDFRDKFFAKLEKETERKEKAAKKEEQAIEKKFEAGILKASKLGMLPEGTDKNKGKYLYNGKFLTIALLKKEFENLENLEKLQADFIRNRDEATATAYDTLIKAELTTPEQIENFLKEANQYNWSKKQKDSINEKVKNAKIAIKEALKNKATETPKAETETAESKSVEKAMVAKTTAKTRGRQAKADNITKTDEKTDSNNTDQPKG